MTSAVQQKCIGYKLFCIYTIDIRILMCILCKVISVIGSLWNSMKQKRKRKRKKNKNKKKTIKLNINPMGSI